MTRIKLALGSALLGLPALLPAASNIGTIVADGRFIVNQMQVPGSATLFEGAMVEALKASVTIQLTDGPRIDLTAGSSGRVFRDRMVLRTGSARAHMGSGYRIETANLVLQPSGQAATALVRVADRGDSVSVPQGQMEILNSGGTLLARLNTGLAMEYGNQGQNPPAQNSQVQLTGKLVQADGHYFLKDSATQIMWELIGKVPASEVGKTVTVLGSALQDHPDKPADRVARIDTVNKTLGGFPCLGGGGKPGQERIQISGPVQKREGHYLLTDKVSNVVSELSGNLPNYENGAVVTVKGELVKNATPISPALQVIKVDQSKLGGAGLLTGCQTALIAGAAVSAAGIGAGLVLSNEPGSQVSQ